MEYNADDSKMILFSERLKSFKDWPFDETSNCSPEKVISIS
jgi:hypothetical protein